MSGDPKIRFPVDESGELRIGMLAEDGFVKVAFDRPITWFALDPADPDGLEDFIRGLRRKGKKALKQRQQRKTDGKADEERAD